MKTRYIDLIEQTFDFPREEFKLDDDQLIWNGLQLTQLIEKHGTPMRITYLPKIGEKIEMARNSFRKAFDEHGYKGCVCIELEDQDFNGSEATEKLGLQLGARYLEGC